MSKPYVRVAVIGAGVSGIIAAIEFKKKLGIEVDLFEREARPGGTWFVNTYPGCACDIPSHWYSLSSEQNPYWSQTFSSQSEIQAYWEHVFEKHDLERQTRFRTNFVRADWDAQRQLYVIQLEDMDDRSKTFTHEAEVLISAIGGFSTPTEKPEGMKGLERFHGTTFHSARWRHDIPLQGKRVGVIGNGCSAAQFIPIISNDPKTSIINFSRTPSWIAPRFNMTISSAQKKAFAYIPYLQTIYRAGLVSLLDARWITWPLPNKVIREKVEKQTIAYMKSKAPAEYLDFLVPKYPMGCKRIIMDPGYLDALNRPNVSLITSPIDTVTEKGILTQDGRDHEFDVLILATGFDFSSRAMGISVYNEKGTSITDQWQSQGGPQAYLGATLSNFPNFYVLLAPNVVTGHTSAIASIECEINYAVKMVEPMLTHGVKSFTLKEKAEADYNSWLHQRANNTVWSQCSSWYRHGNGKIVAAWPGTFAYYWWLTRTPNFSHYAQKGGSRNIAIMARIKFWARILALLAAVAVLQLHGLASLRVTFRSLL